MDLRRLHCEHTLIETGIMHNSVQVFQFPGAQTRFKVSAWCKNLHSVKSFDTSVVMSVLNRHPYSGYWALRSREVSAWPPRETRCSLKPFVPCLETVANHPRSLTNSRDKTLSEHSSRLRYASAQNVYDPLSFALVQLWPRTRVQHRQFFAQSFAVTTMGQMSTLRAC